MTLIPVTKVNFLALYSQILSILEAMTQARITFLGKGKKIKITISAALAVAASLCAPANLAAQAQNIYDAPLAQQAQQPKRKKLVLALGGGGTRGAAHIGVLKVLTENNIKIDAIVGTSVGAIVGGLYCSGVAPDKLESVLLNKSFLHSYLTVPIAVRIMAVPIFFLPHLVGYHPYDGLYRGNRFRKYIDAHVPLENKDIENLPIKFGAVCCDLLNAEPYTVRTGDIGRAIQASSAIPALRRPVPFDKDCPGNTKIKDGNDSMALLVDGGLQANLPVEEARIVARELGDDTVVIAVNVNPVFERTNAKTFRRIGSVSKRALNIFLTEVDKTEIAKANLVIQPQTKEISILSTNFDDARKAVKAGEESTLAAMPEIKALIGTGSN